MRFKQCLVIFCFIGALSLGPTVNLSAEDSSQPSERSLSLIDCIEFAINNSFEVKLARLDFLISRTDITAAQAVYDIVISADMSYEKDQRQKRSVLSSGSETASSYSVDATKTLPSGTELTLSLSDTRDWADSSAYITENPAHTAEASIVARQPIGKNKFGYIDQRDISVTELAVANADLDTKERIENLLAEVEKAYWQWTFFKRSLHIHQQILDRAKELQQVNSKNFELGRIEKADSLASQANVLIREKDLALVENQYRQAEEAIKLLINLEADQRIHPAEDLQHQKIEVDLEKCLNAAFVNRRDYQQAKREIEKKELTLETKANALWPEVDLVASLAANGVHSEFGHAMSNIISDDNNSKFYTGIEFSMPLENSTAKSEHDKARHTKQKALVTLKDVERTIVTEAGNAFRDYQTFEVNFAKLEEAARLQHEKLKEEEQRFHSGRSNTKTLIDYQNDYLIAQLVVAQGIVDLQVARVNLEKALNSILEKYTGLL